MNVLIVGGGAGGVSMIECLCSLSEIRIVGVVDIKIDAPAMIAAERIGIKIFTDLKQALQVPSLDIVLDVTGSKKAHETISDLKPSQVHLADPLIANMLFIMSEQKGKTNQYLQEQIGHMHEIVNKSKKNIDGIVNVIEKVASQTKILGINAAIEAARAGEHGVGFGVVANEVRNLADSSYKSAKGIGDILGDIESSIRQIVKSIETTTTQAH